MTTYETLTAAQIRQAIGLKLAARAATCGDVYNTIRAGRIADAIGMLMPYCVGRGHGSCRETVRRVRLALDAMAVE